MTSQLLTDSRDEEMNEMFISVVSAAIFLLGKPCKGAFVLEVILAYARTHGAASENVGAVRCRDGDDCFIRSRCFPASVCK